MTHHASVLSDTRGDGDAVGHDGRDQEELDRSAEEERPAQQVT